MEHYKDYQKLIRKAAWKKLKYNCGMELEDLVSEGNIAYCEALKTHDKDKGAFSTHLTWKLRHRLNRATEAQKLLTEQINEEEIASCEDIQTQIDFELAVERLSSEAKEVLYLIFNSATELCDLTISPVMITIDNIKLYLKSSDWPIRKVNKVINEIRQMLKNIR